MRLRLLEVYLPNVDSQLVVDFLQQEPIVGIWQTPVGDVQQLVRVLILAQAAESVIDRLETRFSQADGFRIVLLPVEATVPRPESVEAHKSSITPSSHKELEPQTDRINRQELYEDIASSVVLTWTHILMVLLSTIIAAIGLLRDNSTIITGAMVIAPLLGPNMALALAATLGDRSLILRSLKIGGIGIGSTLTLSIAIGWFFSADPDIPEIAFRTHVSILDVILALASGVAGALSLTSGTTSAIVGVMVAVALLPPLVAFGMLLGAGYEQEAIGAFLLLLTNLICLNLAGVVTFSVQNIRPRKWWEAYRARITASIAFVLWLLLLSALIAGIIVWQRSYQL